MSISTEIQEKDADLKIGILGSKGRMGCVLAAMIENAPNMSVTATADKGDDVAGVFRLADVVIDFTPPGNTASTAVIAARHSTAYVVGTTGLSIADQAALDKAAERCAVVQAGNFSLGVNILAALTEKTARLLSDEFDIEILEMHHRRKVDAPSGTAMLLGEAAALGRAVELQEAARYERYGLTGERLRGEIGFATLRGGSVTGDHSVIFASDEEQITLHHHAESRDLFARGALVATRFAASASAGRYSMREVLKLDSL